jgi:predicted DNA-binding transcriptional regulator AlpA
MRAFLRGSLSHMEVAMRSFSVDEWCQLHGFSRSFFYKLATQGEAPKTFKIGRCTRISEAAAVEWVSAREALAA